MPEHFTLRIKPIQRKILLFILFSLISVKGYCQQFYAATSDGLLELISMTSNGPVSQPVPGCGTNNYFSIAVLNNKIYFNSINGNLYSADITGGNTPSISNCTLISYNVQGDALTIDDKGILYFVNGYRLYSIDPKNPTPVFLGTMPYSAAGDLAFYNNQLYMAAPEGVVKVQLGNPAASTLYISIPNASIFGLTTFILNGKNTIYALSGGNTGSTDLLELDMQNKVVKGVAGSLPYIVYDAGSQGEAGNVVKIKVDSINVAQQCDAFNQAHVQIFCKPDSTQHTFTLNTGQTDTTGIFNNLAPGNYQLIITSNGNVLEKDTSFTVADYTTNNPVITVTKKNPLCNTPGQIKLDAGTANSSYTIKYGNDIFTFDYTFTGLSAGTYHFVILNKNGCITDEKDYTLQQDICPPVIIDNINITQQCDVFNRADVQIVCKADSTQHTFTLSTGQTDTTGTFDNLAPGNYHLTITSNGNKLQKDTSFTVADYALNNPLITITQKDPICEQTGEIKLDAGSADSQYSIKYGNDVFSFDHTFTGLTAGSYHFTILNKMGCIADEKDYTLQQDECPLIIITNIQIEPECDVFGQASITVTTLAHSATYTYTLNNISNTTGVFDFLKPGTYDLTISSSNGNNLEQQVVVPDFTLNKPTITYAVKNPVCTLPGEIKFTIAGVSNSTVQVKHGADIYALDQTIKNLPPGLNSFTFFNQQGCIIDTLDVNVLQDACNPIVFPNTFTPNGDNINDIFRPKQDSNPLTFKLLIFDRWGALLFQSQSLFNGWNGNTNDKPAPFGVYYWIATYTMADGNKGIQSGYVTLIR